jgi:hypothetical protein
VVRFARLITGAAAPFGGPSALAAEGGDLGLTWSARRVVQSECLDCVEFL